MKGGKHSLLQREYAFKKSHRRTFIGKLQLKRELFPWIKIKEQYNGSDPQQHFLLYQCYKTKVKFTGNSH